MDDFISREAAKKRIRDSFPDLANRCEINAILNSIPAADVVEVVRCKDCIHDNSNDTICPIPWVNRMLDSFCSFGERRADND